MVAKVYFPETPCRRGHLGPRYAKGGACIQCHKEMNKAKHLATRDVALARMKTWRCANRKKAAALTSRWVKMHPARIAASNKKYQQKNRAKIKAYRDKWIEQNREKVRLWSRLRRARQRGAEGSHTVEDIIRIRKAQRDRCAYCRCKLNGGGDVDHIIPLLWGGSNWPSNLQLLCDSCNSSKCDKDPIEFACLKDRLL